MTAPLYRDLRRVALRASRRADEADDLVQEALLAAVAAGRTAFDDAANRAWLAGTIRNKAAMAGRSAARGRRRDGSWLAGRADAVAPAQPGGFDPGALPPSLRPVLALVLTGHTRREIAYLLRLTDPALRQRVAALRKLLRGHEMPGEFIGLSAVLDHGRIRKALGRLLSGTPGVLASHDPDGHLFIISTPRTSRIAVARQLKDGMPFNERKPE